MSMTIVPIDHRPDGTVAVSMRALHEGLGVGRDFTTWAHQMFGYGFDEGTDFVEVLPGSGENPSGGRPRRDWALTLDAAKEISMLQRTERGQQVRRYFIQVEKEARSGASLALPQDYASALRALASEVEERQRLEAHAAAQAVELETARPKVEVAERLLDATTDMSVQDAANDLTRAGFKIGRQRLFALLQEKGWIFRGGDGAWRPYARVIESGRLSVLPSSHYHPRTGELVLDPPQVRVTPKGLQQILLEHGPSQGAIVGAEAVSA